MRQDIVGDTGIALRNGRAQNLFANPYGIKFRGYKTGNSYMSPFYLQTAGTLAVAATRIHYTPFPVLEAGATFNRCYTYNQSAADTGEKYRTGVYADDGSAGPGTLILSFGEVTLDGASSLRTQTISLDLSAYNGQIVWLAEHHESATSMFDMTCDTVAVGTPAAYFGPLLGSISNSFLTAGLAFYPSRTVDTAYAALASTAVAPTIHRSVSPLIALGKV